MVDLTECRKGERSQGVERRNRLRYATSIVVVWGQLLSVCTLGSQSASAATYYVDPSGPMAAAANGSNERPYRTIHQAVRALVPGDELILRSGTYREVLDFRDSALAQASDSNQRTIVRAETAGTVTIKGSEIVTGWKQLGPGLFVKKPWTTNSQQIFLNGTPLAQIGGTNFATTTQWPGREPGDVLSLRNNSFYWDERAGALYIKTDSPSLDELKVEVSVRPYLLIATKLSGLVVDGIAFSHSNTTASVRHGCVTLNGNRLSLQRLAVSYCDGIGILLHGDDNEVKASTVTYCGQLGMHIHGKRVQVVENETNYNNTRGFDKWWEAGGVKFTGNGAL